MKKTILSIIGIVLIAFSVDGCNLLKGDETPKERNPIKVKIETVGHGSSSETISYSGSVEPETSMPLSFLVTGAVKKIYVNEGDIVKKGTLLAEIDEKSYRDSYEINLAALKRAEDAYNRLKPMYEKGNIPEIQFIEVQTAYNQAKSSTSIFEKNLTDCKLYSPGNGIIGSRSIEIGMNVAPTMPAFTVVDIKNVKIKVPIPENEIDKIKAGQKSTVKIAALGNRVFEGIVREVGVIAHPLSHSYTAKVLLENPGLIIKPGMVTFVNIIPEGPQNIISINGSAISIDENGTKYVYVTGQNNTIANKKIIKTGRILKDKIEILTGLKIGDNVIIEGQHKLSDNERIEL